MHVFSKGKVIAQSEDLEQLEHVTEGRNFPNAPGIVPAWLRTEKGFILEKAPGHAFILAFFSSSRTRKVG